MKHLLRQRWYYKGCSALSLTLKKNRSGWETRFTEHEWLAVVPDMNEPYCLRRWRLAVRRNTKSLLRSMFHPRAFWGVYRSGEGRLTSLLIL